MCRSIILRSSSPGIRRISLSRLSVSCFNDWSKTGDRVGLERESLLHAIQIIMADFKSGPGPILRPVDGRGRGFPLHDLWKCLFIHTDLQNEIANRFWGDSSCKGVFVDNDPLAPPHGIAVKALNVQRLRRNFEAEENWSERRDSNTPHNLGQFVQKLA